MKFTFLQANNPKKIDSFFVYYMSQNNGYFLPQIPGSTEVETIDILPQTPYSTEADKIDIFIARKKKRFFLSEIPLYWLVNVTIA